MVNRISTNHLYDSVTTRINDLYSEVGRLATKRGNKRPYDSFEEVGDRYKISTVIELNQNYSMYHSYMSGVKSASFKMDKSIQALDDIISIAGELLKDISIERSDTHKREPALLENSASVKLSEMQTALNSSTLGYYVFAGSKTNLPPVQNIETPNFINEKNPATFSEDKIVTRYYSGNNDSQSVILEKGLKIDYGITADNELFAKVIAAAHMAKSYGEEPENLKRAEKILEDTTKDLISLSQQIKSKKNITDKYSERYRDLFLQLATKQNDIDESNGLDTLSTILRTTNIETALSASQYLLMKMEEMSLLQFLK